MKENAFSTLTDEQIERLSQVINLRAMLEQADTLTSRHELYVLTSLFEGIVIHAGDTPDLAALHDHMKSRIDKTIDLSVDIQSLLPKCKEHPQASRKARHTPSRTNSIPVQHYVEWTFTKRADITVRQLVTIHTMLVSIGWIDPQSDIDAFVNLFTGESSRATVIWTGKAGKGVLRDLFQMMINDHYITPPTGYGYLKVLESHFVDTNNQHLTDLKGGSHNKKAELVIQQVKNVLNGTSSAFGSAMMR